MVWIVQGVGVAVLVAVAPWMWGIAQTVKARCQGRRGPAPGQLYWIIRKHWHKETTVPDRSSWVFRLAPSVSMASLVLIVITIPIAGRVPPEWPHNMLTLFFLLALERFWSGLAGLDTGGTFGGLGASRITTLGTGIEPALFAALGIAWQVSGDGAIVPLAAHLTNGSASLLPWALASVSVALVLLAEWGRLPVDNPDTHLELTMMHEATLLEYDGRFLALSEWAMALKFTALATFGWVVLGPHLPSLWANLGLRIIEIAATAGVLGWVESGLTKLRYFQLPAYLAVAAGLGMLGFYLAAGGLSL